MYPANLSYLNTITVASSTHQNAKYVDSNYGLNSVDLFAPGSNILSCIPGGYTVSSSTRSAAAYVAAVAALMLSENPNLTSVQMKAKIKENCTQVNLLSPYCRTGGIVNAYKSVLNSYYPYVLTLNSDVTSTMSQGVHRWFKFTAPSSGTYYFYTEGDIDTLGELFDSSTGLLEYEDDIVGDDGEESNYNFYISQALAAGQVVYIRVTAADWKCSGTFKMKIRTNG